jgi:hypothetical protein
MDPDIDPSLTLYPVTFSGTATWNSEINLSYDDVAGMSANLSTQAQNRFPGYKGVSDFYLIHRPVGGQPNPDRWRLIARANVLAAYPGLRAAQQPGALTLEVGVQGNGRDQVNWGSDEESAPAGGFPPSSPIPNGCVAAALALYSWREVNQNPVVFSVDGIGTFSLDVTAVSYPKPPLSLASPLSLDATAQDLACWTFQDWMPESGQANPGIWMVPIIGNVAEPESAWKLSACLSPDGDQLDDPDEEVPDFEHLDAPAG